VAVAQASPNYGTVLVHSVIPYLRYQQTSVLNTVLPNPATYQIHLSLLSNDYSILSSKIIALNIFIPYSHFQVVQLFPLF